MKFITVYKSSVNRKTPAENILGFRVYFNAVLLRTEVSVVAVLPEYLTALGLWAHRMQRIRI